MTSEAFFQIIYLNAPTICVVYYAAIYRSEWVYESQIQKQWETIVKRMLKYFTRCRVIDSIYFKAQEKW